MKRERIIVSLDPGVVTLGLAFFRAKDATGKKVPVPTYATTYALSSTFKGSPYHKALRLAKFIEAKVDRSDVQVDAVHCETMEFRSNARGVAAIEDVLNVMFSCGVFAHLAETMGASFRPAPVSQWKGQLSKDQVARRIAKAWGGVVPEFLSDIAKPSHDWDAVGVGLWGMGFFN